MGLFSKAKTLSDVNADSDIKQVVPIFKEVEDELNAMRSFAVSASEQSSHTQDFDEHSRVRTENKCVRDILELLRKIDTQGRRLEWGPIRRLGSIKGKFERGSLAREKVPPLVKQLSYYVSSARVAAKNASGILSNVRTEWGGDFIKNTEFVKNIRILLDDLRNALKMVSESMKYLTSQTHLKRRPFGL